MSRESSSDRAVSEWLKLKGEREAMMKSSPGKAVTLVERVVSLVSWTNNSRPDSREDRIECVAFDHVVWFAERMLKLQAEYASQGIPSNVDVGYHYTDAKNLDGIRSNGLLTRGDLETNNLMSEFHGKRFGDGIYTSTNPAAFSAYGNVGLIVGRLQGNALRVTRRLSPGTRVNANTIIGDRLRSDAVLDSGGWPVDSSYNEVVLRSSSQCLPLIKYDSDLAKKRLGQECLANLEHSLGLILHELFDVAPQRCDEDDKSSPLRADQRPPGMSPFSFGAPPALPLKGSTNLFMPQNRPILQSTGTPGDTRILPSAQTFTPQSGTFFGPPLDASTFSPGIFSSVPEPGYPIGETLHTAATSQPLHGSFTFGTFRQSVKGTSAAPYQPTMRPDGTSHIVLESITAMPQYEQKSFEELRLEDYVLSNNGIAMQDIPTTMPDAAQTGFIFGGSDQPGMATPHHESQMNFHSITILPQYEQKSFEELRLEDYFLGNKGSAAPSTSSLSLQPAHVFRQSTPIPPAQVFFGAQPKTIDFSHLPSHSHTDLTSPPLTSMPSQVQPANIDSDHQTLSYVAPLTLTAGIPSTALSAPPPHCSMIEDCVICHEKLFSKGCVTLLQCQHTFHRDCIQQALKCKPQCPICRVTVGALQGKSPSGTMTIANTLVNCSGFEHDGSIVIKYVIPPGHQLEYHENPGARFDGKRVRAFLPNTAEGNDLLKRLKYAFSHGLTFNVGTSVTTQRENKVCWGSIHHKTSTTGGAMKHGFPDENYFANCNGELDGLGVPPANCLHLDDNARKA